MALELLTALALILVIEGVLYALFPHGMKRMLTQVMGLPPSALRRAGVVSVFVGVALVWLLRG